MTKRKFWKTLLNAWTLIIILTLALDFFSRNLYNEASGITSTIYIAILGIYVADKEFERWTDKGRFISKYFGEIFIAIWTVLMIFFLIISLISQQEYHLTNAMVGTYISVLGIFAITQRSKNAYQQSDKIIS